MDTVRAASGSDPTVPMSFGQRVPRSLVRAQAIAMGRKRPVTRVSSFLAVKHVQNNGPTRARANAPVHY